MHSFGWSLLPGLASTCSSTYFRTSYITKSKLAIHIKCLLPFCPGTTWWWHPRVLGRGPWNGENEPRLRVTSDPTPSNPRLHSFQRHATRLTPGNHVSEAPFILNGRQMASQTGIRWQFKGMEGFEEGARGLCRWNQKSWAKTSLHRPVHFIYMVDRYVQCLPLDMSWWTCLKIEIHYQPWADQTIFPKVPGIHHVEEW